MVATVIADIVGSRALPDRAGAQRHIDDALAQVARDVPNTLQALRPVVGDELEGLYARLEDALAATTLLRLALPVDVDCRFGIGVGEVATIHADAGEISDGPGWWAARTAIEHVAALQRRAVPTARTWVVVDGEDADAAPGLANAAALLRDQLISQLNARGRRITYGRCVGRTQRELAESEGVTQSAISQALTAGGSAALIEAFRQLRA